jgi:hypothetical protein
VLDKGYREAILHVDVEPGLWWYFRSCTVSSVELIPSENDSFLRTLTMRYGTVSYHHGWPLSAPGAAAALAGALDKTATDLAQATDVAHHMLRRYSSSSAGKK